MNQRVVFCLNLLILMSATLMVGACGYKGPLVLPEPSASHSQTGSVAVEPPAPDNPPLKTKN